LSAPCKIARCRASRDAAGEEAVVDGVKGTWRLDPGLVGQPFTGPAALLSPFDRLLHNRTRAKAGLLHVNDLHWDADLSKAMIAAVDRDGRPCHLAQPGAGRQVLTR